MCKPRPMDVGILGGTGPAGKALASRLASVGLGVSIGSRTQERAESIVSELQSKWPGRLGSLRGSANQAAATAQIVVVATPWEGASPTVASLAKVLEGKVVVSMANALAKVGTELEAVMPARGSVASAIQLAAPECLVAGAFHHLPARGLGDLDHQVDADVLVCSDHRAATAAAIELVEKIPACRGIDAGTLAAAAAIEAFTAVLIGVNIRRRVHASIRLTGLKDEEGAESRRP